MTTHGPLTLTLWRFDPDADPRATIALRVDVPQTDAEQPMHRHRKGQLVLALRGGVRCEVPGAMWVVPPQHAVWIPGGLQHSNQVTDNARLCMLFVEPDVAGLPTNCCTLRITPLVRELIAHVADLSPGGPHDAANERLVAVLLEQLARMPVERLHVPIPDHSRLRKISDALARDPADRTTLAQWASRLATSDRSLARLVKAETGLTFGRWRQQFQLAVAVGQLAAGASVQQVAGRLGYDSVTAFITMFKAALGKSPGRYFADLGASPVIERGGAPP